MKTHVPEVSIISFSINEYCPLFITGTQITKDFDILIFLNEDVAILTKSLFVLASFI